jgi:hypothetical protein
MNKKQDRPNVPWPGYDKLPKEVRQFLTAHLRERFLMLFPDRNTGWERLLTYTYQGYGRTEVLQGTIDQLYAQVLEDAKQYIETGRLPYLPPPLYKPTGAKPAPEPPVGRACPVCGSRSMCEHTQPPTRDAP